MEEIEERMKQRMLEKFEEQKGTMQQQITINIIARLQCLNPDLQLDPDLLAFCVHSCSLEQTEGRVPIHLSQYFIFYLQPQEITAFGSHCKF
ncbi:hypothetical protein P3L10_030288 [Capsicum annuum]